MESSEKGSFGKKKLHLSVRNLLLLLESNFPVHITKHHLSGGPRLPIKAIEQIIILHIGNK